MDIIEKEGLSVPEAVFSACLTLGIDEKDAQVQVLSSPGARRAKVRVGRPGAAMPPADGPSAQASAPVASSAPEAPLQKPADYAPKSSIRTPPSPERADGLRKDLEQLLRLMGIESAVEVKEHAGNTIFNIKSAKEGLLIGKRGMTLEALQLVAERMLGGAYGVVDVDDYKTRGERKIMDLAKEAAQKVFAEGGQQTLGPLDAAERRLVHLEIKAMDGVESFSVGDGSRKKVVIQKKG